MDRTTRPTIEEMNNIAYLKVWHKEKGRHVYVWDVNQDKTTTPPTINFNSENHFEFEELPTDAFVFQIQEGLNG